MPVALPGYFDTGITRNFTATCGVSLDWRFDFTANQQLDIGDLPPAWRFFWDGMVGVSPPPFCFPDRNGLTGTISLKVEKPDAVVETLETYALACVETDHRITSGTYPYSLTIGPLRLGVRLVVNTSPTPAPIFARHLDYEFAWFVDGYSTRLESCAGFAMPVKYWQAVGGWGATQNTMVTPVNYDGGALSWEADMPTGVSDQIRLSSMTVDGATVDTSELNGSGQVGTGSGIRFDGANLAVNGSVTSPYMLDESAALALFGGVDPAVDTQDSDSNIRTTPWNVSRTRHEVSWATTQPALAPLRTVSMTTAGAERLDPDQPSDDRQLMAHMPPPKQASGEYTPVTISLAPEVEVHRAGGIIPSNWVASDARITVTETMPETVIEVHEEGAYIERTFAGTDTWRNHVGLGTGGTGHADFGIEEYEVYRHNYWNASGDDAWAWGTYAWLAHEIEAPAEGELTMIAAGLHLAITDTHETDLATRTANYVADVTAYDATYPIPLQDGTNIGRVDLLFPAETQPFYHGRVDALRLSGFKVGTYRIKRLALQATGQAYLKICWGKQVQRSDYSALVAAVNGAFVFGNWPDQALKDDETGDYGGGIRFVNLLIGTVSGIIQDSQKTISEFLLLLNKIEGWTATYSTAAHDAAMKDAFGVELAEYAQFVRPVAPYTRLAPGDTFLPPCQIVVGRVKIAPGYRFTVPFDLQVWGALEAQAKTDGQRAEAGALVEAYRLDTGATVATGVTDEDGYVCVSPVPANGAVLVSLREGS